MLIALKNSITYPPPIIRRGVATAFNLLRRTIVCVARANMIGLMRGLSFWGEFRAIGSSPNIHNTTGTNQYLLAHSYLATLYLAIDYGIGAIWRNWLVVYSSMICYAYLYFDVSVKKLLWKRKRQPHLGISANRQGIQPMLTPSEKRIDRTLVDYLSKSQIHAPGCNEFFSKWA